MQRIQHIDYNVEDARDVPGNISLQAGGKSVRRELSLVQIKYEGEEVGISIIGWVD